jgi:hypothetical protein
MKIEIPDEILKNTTKCNKSFGCLKNEKHVLCRVEHCVNEEVYFIKCLNTATCNYRVSFGNSYFCSCPVRMEIFNKYKK